MEPVGRWRVRGGVMREWGVNLDCLVPHSMYVYLITVPSAPSWLMGEGLRRRLRSEEACLSLEDS